MTVPVPLIGTVSCDVPVAVGEPKVNPVAAPENTMLLFPDVEEKFRPLIVMLVALAARVAELAVIPGFAERPA